MHASFAKKKKLEVINSNSLSLRPDSLVHSILKLDIVFVRHISRYFINLTGQEFPLKTNGELVEILKTLNGSNVVMGNSAQ